MPSAASQGARTGRSAKISSLDPGHKSYKWWVLLSVMIGTFMAVLDATVVNVALAKRAGLGTMPNP